MQTQSQLTLDDITGGAWDAYCASGGCDGFLKSITGGDPDASDPDASDPDASDSDANDVSDTDESEGWLAAGGADALAESATQYMQIKAFNPTDEPDADDDDISEFSLDVDVVYEDNNHAADKSKKSAASKKKTGGHPGPNSDSDSDSDSTSSDDSEMMSVGGDDEVEFSDRAEFSDEDSVDATAVSDVIEFEEYEAPTHGGGGNEGAESGEEKRSWFSGIWEGFIPHSESKTKDSDDWGTNIHKADLTGLDGNVIDLRAAANGATAAAAPYDVVDDAELTGSAGVPAAGVPTAGMRRSDPVNLVVYVNHVDHVDHVDRVDRVDHVKEVDHVKNAVAVDRVRDVNEAFHATDVDKVDTAIFANHVNNAASVMHAHTLDAIKGGGILGDLAQRAEAAVATQVGKVQAVADDTVAAAAAAGRSYLDNLVGKARGVIDSAEQQANDAIKLAEQRAHETTAATAEGINMAVSAELAPVHVAAATADTLLMPSTTTVVSATTGGLDEEVLFEDITGSDEEVKFDDAPEPSTLDASLYGVAYDRTDTPTAVREVYRGGLDEIHQTVMMSEGGDTSASGGVDNKNNARVDFGAALSAYVM